MLTLTENDIVDATPRARALHDQRLFTRYHVDGDLAARDALVERFIPLARHLARRYGRDHAHAEDVLQVASIGLLKAIDRYDPTRGIAFTSFATPTILGEIKRYFRDKSWAVRVPRELQELSMKVGRATEELESTLGRPPTAAELAGRLGASVEEVLEARVAATARYGVSLDRPAGGDEDSEATIGARFGVDDHELDRVEDDVTVQRLMSHLDEREREILRLRFQEDMTQAEIGERLGVSQMHVSRLIRRSIATLSAVAGTTTPN